MKEIALCVRYSPLRTGCCGSPQFRLSRGEHYSGLPSACFVLKNETSKRPKDFNDLDIYL